MIKISTGEPSTLGTYRKIAFAIGGFDEKSEPLKFIDQRISESPNGEDEIVIASEHQMLSLLWSLMYK